MRRFDLSDWIEALGLLLLVVFASSFGWRWALLVAGVALLVLVGPALSSDQRSSVGEPWA